MENEDTLKARQPCWLVLCWTVIGLGLDWRCAFEWFSGRCPLYSQAVLQRMSLIVMSCGVAALIAVRVSRGARWRDAGAFFCLVSGMVYGHLSVWWIGHR
jgi:hypothetical protein